MDGKPGRDIRLGVDIAGDGILLRCVGLQKDAGAKNLAIHRVDDDWSFGFEH